MLISFFVSNLSIIIISFIFLFESTSICILFFLLSILLSAFFLFVNGIEFLSFIFLLVYLGAIAILFVFALIFLKLNLKIRPSFSNLENLFIYSIFFQKVIFVFLLLNFNIEICLLLQNTNFHLDTYILYKWQDLNILSILLFLNPIYLLIIGFILLLGMVGSISLCLSL